MAGLACGADTTGPSSSGISITPSSARLLVGNSLTLATTVEGSGTAADVSWSTSDPAVVTVSERGVVRAVGAGNAQVEGAVTGASESVQIQVPEPAGSFDSDGGLFRAAGGVVNLDIPPGALSEETPISVEQAPGDSLPTPGEGARRVPGTAFEFDPRGLSFASGAGLSI